MATTNPAPTPETPITVKINLANGENRRFKLPLRECGANTLPEKLRSLLAVPPKQILTLERFSDSAGSYITLDAQIPSVYKQLYRAAKAKGKLRIKATISGPSTKIEISQPEPVTPDRLTSHCYVPPPTYCRVDEMPIAKKQAMIVDTNVRPAATAPGYEAFKPQPHEDLSIRDEKHAVPAPKRITVHDICGPTQEADFPKSQPAKSTKDEAPVPHSFCARENFYAELASMSKESSVVNPIKVNEELRITGRALNVPGTSFTICCNQCDKAIPDDHWHCSICDAGDFDLCISCVERGVLCASDGHWLIKRFVKDGVVINSTTETMPSKNAVKSESDREVPGAFTLDTKEELVEFTRTCNGCIGVYDDSVFVTCMHCDDYDLCLLCHLDGKHGHHPNHPFAPASESTVLNARATALCSPGRNVRHLAICDGCDKNIYGVRHKCMDCPDWDYCGDCIKGAGRSHPKHRFVPVYEPLPTSAPSQRHWGIHCDGPLCVTKSSYITGDRYKCAVCHDTDFCANCEALPTHRHNRTHPLIKFRSPVRNVSVTTMGEKGNGEVMTTMGDKYKSTSSKSTETTPAASSSNAATQVQTVAEVQPTESVKEESKKSEIVPPIPDLQAHFVRDAVPDGSKLTPNKKFIQVWTLRNPGPNAWPAGCSVRNTGGDNMLNVDPNHPTSVSDIAKATESNVLGHAVEVGQEAHFVVMLRTPQREGKAISYWRLKTADGKAFGHKLWCDIDVCIPKPEPIPSVQHIEDIAKEGKAEDIKVEAKLEEKGVKTEEIKKEVSESQMIFPKLEKESPVTSTHEAQTAPVAAPVEDEERDLLEDVESLGLDDEDTDDGFLTDEDYELVGSDEEMGEAVNGKGKK